MLSATGLLWISLRAKTELLLRFVKEFVNFFDETLVRFDRNGVTLRFSVETVMFLEMCDFSRSPGETCLLCAWI